MCFHMFSPRRSLLSQNRKGFGAVSSRPEELFGGILPYADCQTMPQLTARPIEAGMVYAVDRKKSKGYGETFGDVVGPFCFVSFSIFHVWP